MNSVQVDAYLRRIGAERPASPTVDALRELHLRHLRAVPFENLSIHLGEEIVLDEKPLLDKAVGAHRGGFCYEQNGVFAALLRELGFGVTLLAARVFGDGGRLGIPYDHLALRVRTTEGATGWPTSGSGRTATFRRPWGSGGSRRIRAGCSGWPERGRAGEKRLRVGEWRRSSGDLDVWQGGKPVYRLETRPRVLGDFVLGAWWHSTSPVSHFRKSLVCSRMTEDGGRITLSGRTLTVTSPDGGRKATEPETDETILETYRERFGIELERVPRVRKD